MIRIPHALAALAAAGVLLASAPARPAPAQTPGGPQVVASDTLVEVRLADGSVLYGRIEAVTAERVTIVTTGGGRLEIDRAQIRTLRPIRGATRDDGQFWPADPNGTRLFFGPTGRSLGAGQASFGVFELFFPFASYGVTDRFSIAGGTPVIPELIGEVGYIAPKLQVVRSQGAQVSIGALAAFGTDEVATAGLLYGVGTFGDADDAVTAAVAVPFFTDGDDGDLGTDPLVMLGGELRTSRRLKLLTENYFLAGESGAAVSGGVRIMGDRLTADFGVAALIGTDGGCCLPLLNFVYTFGGSR